MELAPLPGLPETGWHPGFQNCLTRSRGRWKWRPWLASTTGPNPLGLAGCESATTGARGVRGVGLCVAARTADSRLLGRHSRRFRGVSRGLSKSGKSRCRAAHGSGRLRSDRATEWEKDSFRVRNCRSLVCSSFALKDCRFLVSGVWLKKQASVAAEVSGRGLARGGKTVASEGTTESWTRPGRLRSRDQ